MGASEIAVGLEFETTSKVKATEGIDNIGAVPVSRDLMAFLLRVASSRLGTALKGRMQLIEWGMRSSVF
jgi:hypothetical protein